MDPEVRQIQEQLAIQHDVMVQRFEHQLSSQDHKLDLMFSMLQQMAKDVAEMKEANRSSSTSAGRVACPMQCGADFKKVLHICNLVNSH
jgi:hypothetical protein